MNRFGVLVVCAFVLACSETPQRAWEDMHSAACERDTTRFFSRVDKTAIGESLLKKVGGEKPSALVESIGRKQMQEGFTAWEDDIKKGEAGDWCGAKFKLAGSANRVYWTTPSGEEKGGRFEQFDGKWILVELIEP